MDLFLWKQHIPSLSSLSLSLLPLCNATEDSYGCFSVPNQTNGKECCLAAIWRETHQQMQIIFDTFCWIQNADKQTNKKLPKRWGRTRPYRITSCVYLILLLLKSFNPAVGDFRGNRVFLSLKLLLSHLNCLNLTRDWLRFRTHAEANRWTFGALNLVKQPTNISIF